jgi:hypothetical protein
MPPDNAIVAKIGRSNVGRPNSSLRRAPNAKGLVHNEARNPVASLSSVLVGGPKVNA